MTKLEEIISCIKGNSVYVQMHNFPDPDAIASAYGMKYLLRAEGQCQHNRYALRQDNLYRPSPSI